MTSHARKNAAREQQELSGRNRRAALQDVRDALQPAPEARRASARAGTDVADHAVPVELLALVLDHSRRSGKYLDKAVGLGRSHGGYPSEWQRLVLYALTDAHAHLQLLIGTLAAALQQHGVDDDRIRRHLQSPDPDRYITQHALDHLAGLTGTPVPDGQEQPIWHYLGTQVAQRAHDELERQERH
ncbi:hypothetical protein [Streptomyces sp. NPDC096193]|uniref:hypothetical protein n=1 Tax=Streptomyces sp. NPDC096193 TaxID=3155821 RepID=UPI003325048D